MTSVTHRRTIAERVTEATNLRRQLDTWLLQADVRIADVPELARFAADLNTYVRDGVSISDTIRVPSLLRTFRYRLSTQRHVRCAVDILYTPSLRDRVHVTPHQEGDDGTPE